MRVTRIDLLEVRIYEDRTRMGTAAATDCADELRRRIYETGACRAIFAAAPSQRELLAGLVAAADVDWGRVTAFHMDEYIGLGPEAPQSFARFLRAALFDRLPFERVHLLSPGSRGAEAEAKAYAALLAMAPVDVVCLGVGENGHLAFNDPPADLDDPRLVREVGLDETCRRQQVNDGCFAALDEVPTRALTLTVPALMAGRRLFCVVPGPSKARAVREMLLGPISGRCPASALRRHGACTLYLDRDSAAEFLAES
jgi:glucosamine-6-phosphate deaminase